MRMNAAMAKRISMARWDDITLPIELEDCVVNGFIECDGCFLLAKFSKNMPSQGFSIDKTGIECFVNSFHVDDYVQERYLDYACLFCNKIVAKWHKDRLQEELNIIISLDENSLVIKLHIRRENESWLDENLESYEQAILETNEIITSQNTISVIAPRPDLKK